MGIDLPLIWLIIIGFGLMMYVIMDGFDLGIGLLFPFINNEHDKDTMVNTVAPVWDGNETWLVLGGASLMAAFPLAYSFLLSELYIPLIFMLIGLIWRGVAFEFRFKSDLHHKPFWDKAFAAGSYLATFCQGACLGAFITGVKVTGPSYTGGAFDWLTPFSVFTGLGLLVTYALLGSTWLIMKTEGRLQRQMITLTRPVTWLLLFMMAGVTVWTPFINQAILNRWFSLPNLFFLLPVPILVVLFAWGIFHQLKKQTHAAAFILTLGLIFLGYTGLGLSIWPNIIPPDVSIWQAAAPQQSMGFALVGALFIIPFILAYTAWSYYVFRGKVREGEGYHH